MVHTFYAGCIQVPENSRTTFQVIVTVAFHNNALPRPVITCSKLEIKTLEQGVKYVQS